METTARQTANAARVERGSPGWSGRQVHEADVVRARSMLSDDATYEELSALFGALADGTRVKLVHVLLRQQLCTRDLAATVGVSESATSQHLRLLRALRLVKSKRTGKVVYHSLDDEHIESLVRVGLIHLGHVGQAALLSGARAHAAGGGPA